jgi:flagellar biosynthesis/type III secretory pathway M-ring protein FliF/YscJ
MSLILQVVVSVPPPPPVPAPAIWQVHAGMPPETIAILSLAGLIAGVIVLWPLVRAWARRIEGRGQPSQAAFDEVEQLRQRVAQLEELSHRVAELEERADFAERMLTQTREPDRLPARGQT